MIFRLLLLFLIVWFLFYLIKKQFNKVNSDRQNPNLDNNSAEDMVACAHCGTHVPKSLAIVSNDQYYCSQEHADLDE